MSITSKRMGLTVLEQGRGFVKKGWNKQEFAYDVNGRPVSTTSPDAVTWCALGGMLRASKEMDSIAAQDEAETAFMAANRITTIGYWNDKKGRTKEQVLKAFDRAIAWMNKKIAKK